MSNSPNQPLNPKTPESDQPLRGLVILVVEDEFLIALDIEVTLRDAGAEVVGPFADLLPARRAAGREPLSVAILDFRLGADTTQEIAEILIGRSIPILYYTGQSLPTGLAHTAVISKPATGRTLVDAVVVAMQRPA